MPTTKPSRVRMVAVGLGLGLLLTTMSTVTAAGAATDREGATVTADRVSDADRVRPVPVDRRPDHRIEVLKMRCKVVDHKVADDRVTDEKVTDAEKDSKRIHTGCKWRKAKHPKAAGYQLWRIVDRGEREMVARGGLDMLGARDVVPGDATVVRYAVLAIDEDGNRVGQSRVQRLVLRERSITRTRVS